MRTPLPNSLCPQKASLRGRRAGTSQNKWDPLFSSDAILAGAQSSPARVRLHFGDRSVETQGNPTPRTEARGLTEVLERVLDPEACRLTVSAKGDTREPS